MNKIKPSRAAAALARGLAALIAAIALAACATVPGSESLELRSLNYDPRSRRVLDLAEVLEGADPDWLQLVSKAARADLSERLNPAGDLDIASWIDEGAGPEPENYSCFVFGPGLVTIHFQPYQVAPWSAGSQSVVLSRDARALE